MLDKFRRGASKLLASLLFCILIVSFAFWGIPNYNKDYSQSTIAKVGNVTLTEEEYRRFFDQQINVLSAQSGQRLTRENARMFYRFQAMQQGNFTADLDREVLNIQVNQALLDSQAKALGLGLADTAIVDAIRSDPQYQGPDKSFNRALFEDRVRQAGFSDVGYIRERKASDIRGQLTDALSTGLKPSQTLIDIAHKFSEEQRTVTIVTLDPLKQPKIADPDDAKLMQYYELNKRQYSAPEMRKLVLLFLGRDDIKSRAGVEDSEVKSTWERDKNAWNIPERRRFQQIVFKTKLTADGVAKEIAAGKSFMMAALEEDANSRLDLGLTARASIPDGKVQAAVFSLPLSKVSQPIEIRNGVLLVRVTEIQPGRTRPFEEVAKEIRDDLEQKKQREVATRLHDQIEDLRGSGKTLKQVADDLKLKLTDIEQVSKTGIGADGKPAIVHPEASRLIAAAFEGGKDIPRDPMELADGGQAWIEVADIMPERQKTLDEVKAEVKTAWLEVETRKALSAAAQALVDRIKAGETVEAVAKSLGLKPETQKPFKRGGPFVGIPPNAGRQAFTLPKGGAGSAETQDGKTRVIYVVSQITLAAAPTKEETERLSQALQSQFQRDVQAVYVAALRSRVGVQIDEAALKRVSGTEQPQ